MAILFRSAVAMLAMMTIAGCVKDPLIFNSATTVGIKIAVSPSESQPLKLQVGFDQVDSAIVPTSTEAGAPQILSRDDGCVTKDEKSIECGDLTVTITRPSPSSSSEPGPEPSPGLHDITELPPGKGGKRIRSDALSVLSNFSTTGKAKSGGGSAEAGFTIGKLFATGLAAQNISEGIGEGLSQQQDAQKRCLMALQNALGEGKVDKDTAVKVCGAPQSMQN